MVVLGPSCDSTLELRFSNPYPRVEDRRRNRNMSTASARDEIDYKPNGWLLHKAGFKSNHIHTMPVRNESLANE
jgi:hypothetical protein